MSHGLSVCGDRSCDKLVAQMHRSSFSFFANSEKIENRLIFVRVIDRGTEVHSLFDSQCSYISYWHMDRAFVSTIFHQA